MNGEVNSDQDKRELDLLELDKIRKAGGILTPQIAKSKDISSELVCEFFISTYVNVLMQYIEKSEKDNDSYMLADVLYYLVKEKPKGATIGQIGEKFTYTKYKLQYVLGCLSAINAVEVSFFTQKNIIIMPTMTAKILLDEIVNKRKVVLKITRSDD